MADRKYTMSCINCSVVNMNLNGVTFIYIVYELSVNEIGHYWSNICLIRELYVYALGIRSRHSHYSGTFLTWVLDYEWLNLFFNWVNYWYFPFDLP